MNTVKIIIVDDLAFMRDTIRSIIEKSGMTVIGEAENGNEALSLYKEMRPDVILMDITMPVMDGLESLRLIREYDPQARVIMCSAMGQQRYIIKAIQFGAKDFVLKPFHAIRIISAIKKAIGINDK